MPVGCRLPEMVTGRLAKCCVTFFHLSCTAPGAYHLLPWWISSALLLALFYRGGKGKVRTNGLLCAGFWGYDGGFWGYDGEFWAPVPSLHPSVFFIPQCVKIGLLWVWIFNILMPELFLSWKECGHILSRRMVTREESGLHITMYSGEGIFPWLSLSPGSRSPESQIQNDEENYESL